MILILDSDSDDDDDCQISRLAEFDPRHGIDPMSEFVKCTTVVLEKPQPNNMLFYVGGDVAIRLMRLQINLLAL